MRNREREMIKSWKHKGLQRFFETGSAAGIGHVASPSGGLRSRKSRREHRCFESDQIV